MVGHFYVLSPKVKKLVMAKFSQKIRSFIGQKAFAVFCSILKKPKFFNWAVIFFSQVAAKGVGTNKCLENGFLPVPVHFYSPIPDLKDLEKRKVWDQRSNMKGINFDIKRQLGLLDRLGKKFSHECVWPFAKTTDETEFHLDNNSFLYGDAASLHCLIREFKPRRIIEIGSGYSSKVISRALELNKKEVGKQGEYIIIDPYPPEYVSKKLIKFTCLIKERVELIDAKFFERLSKNDILFIDSGHSVRIGSDVNYLYLEVLPRLKNGVIVHCHDIDMPYEYPKCYSTNEVFRQFWTERYLLQAFLIFNNRFEVILPMGYLMRNHIAKFKKLFRSYNPLKPGGRLSISVSFWMRRK